MAVALVEVEREKITIQEVVITEDVVGGVTLEAEEEGEIEEEKVAAAEAAVPVNPMVLVDKVVVVVQ